MGWASKDKSSKKNVLEVGRLFFFLCCFCVAMVTNVMAVCVAEDASGLRIPDAVRHGKYHQRLAQSHPGDHQAAGNSHTRTRTFISQDASVKSDSLFQDQEHLSEDEDDTSDKEDKDRKRTCASPLT